MMVCRQRGRKPAPPSPPAPSSSLASPVAFPEVRRALTSSARDSSSSQAWAGTVGSGEQLRVTVEGDDLRVTEIAMRRVGSWYDPSYGWLVVEPGAGAPYAGWYRVKLSTTKQRGAAPIVTLDTSR